ncbi:hypothetical protein [Escherichia coli]|uniref:hypothetical protein n=1 Tax=Escherichia coli TaxID=562 RepID=UPI00388D7670
MIKGRILFPALTALSVTGGIFRVLGLMEWQESKIAKNILTIREQENTLAKLEAKPRGDVRQWREREISGVAGRGERGKHRTVGDKNAVRLVRSKRV